MIRSRVLFVSLLAGALAPFTPGCGDSTVDDSSCTGAACGVGAGGQSGAGKGGSGGAGKGGAGAGGAGSGGAGASGKGGAGMSGNSGQGGAGAAGSSGASGQAGAGGQGGAGQAGSSGAAGDSGAGGNAGESGSAGASGSAGSSGSAGAGAGGAGAAGAAGSGGAAQVFPSDPILDGGAQPDAPSKFPPFGGDPSGGPCLYEPEDQTLLPRNWLRPRFSFTPTGGANLFEIRVTAEGQSQPLLVYTDQTSWTMPAALWAKVSGGLASTALTVTVRGGKLDGGVLSNVQASATHAWRVAPVDAAGTIVYWTTSGGSSLKGFAVGEETVTPVLTPSQVEMKTTGGAAVTCIGCHTSTPDGLYAAFTAQGPWANAVAAIKPPAIGGKPPFFGSAAEQLLGSLAPLGIETFSKAHWSDGDHIEVVPVGDGHNQLAWLDLEATSVDKDKGWGVIERQGDTRGAGAPAWTHDGSKIVYVSTDASFTGRLDNGAADLYAVPYNNRKGGAATPLAGASDPAINEYYPALTGDDALLFFNAIPTGNNMYNAPLAEVFVLPSGGGARQRLAANDPPACTGRSSPGVTNSWPKSAPEVGVSGDDRYYWVIFSSVRGAAGNPQLYLSAVVAHKDGSLSTHGAAYLWNQPPGENNHTPAWDVFDIKP